VTGMAGGVWDVEDEVCAGIGLFVLSNRPCRKLFPTESLTTGRGMGMGLVRRWPDGLPC
jgi:hypothetical protein